MVEFLKPHRTDLSHITALLVIAAVPLVALRCFPTAGELAFHGVLWGSIFAELALVWAWRRSIAAALPPMDSTPVTAPRSGWHWTRGALVIVLLAGLVLVNFTVPMVRHFWGGVDDVISLFPWNELFWSNNFDRVTSRPMGLLQVGVSRLLTPERIEGFMLLAAVLCLANGLLVAGILRHFYRDNWLVPVLGAALFIVNPCDTSRFYIIWTTNCYWMALFFCLLGSWLFLIAAEQGSRVMLVGACVALLAGGLSSEGVLPLACLAPGLLWLSGRGAGRLIPWTFAWYGVMALLTVRFGTHLYFDDEIYQAKKLGEAGVSFESLTTNAWDQISRMELFWNAGVAMRPFRVPAALAVLLFVAGCALVSVGRRAAPGLKRSSLGVLTACLAVACGMLPFVWIAGCFRTRFLAGPGEAALLACLIGCVASCLPGRIGIAIGTALAVACASWLVATTTVVAWATQERARTESTATFEKTVDVFDQVRSLSPSFTERTLVLFLVESYEESPVGPGVVPDHVGFFLMGESDIVQAVVSAPPSPGQPPRRAGAVSFSAKGVQAQCYFRGEMFRGYDEVVLYRLSRDGEATLLRQIPDYLFPASKIEVPYAPFARMQPGPVTPLKLFRYPLWSVRPHDVLDYRDGIRLGDNWAELHFLDGKLSRWACDGAEILINPAGNSERTLRFILDTKLTPQPCTLEAIDEAGKVVATTTGGAGEVELALPLDPERINVFRLRLKGPSAGRQRFRIERAGAPVPLHPKYHGPARLRTGLTGSEITLKGGWHGLEGAREGKIFRWVDNDADLMLNSLGIATTLVLEVEPGPGLGRRVGELTVTDKSGDVLATESIAGRQLVYVPLPTGRLKNLELRLHITNGGTPIPSDPRILNFRVLRAELSVENAELRRDLGGRGIILKGGWHGLESEGEGKPFRWVDNDAELLVRTRGNAATLLLEVEPGPCLAGRPGELTVADKSGKVLATQTLTGRQSVRVPLPADQMKNLELRLHITNGGTTLPTDPRILNFRVFRADISMDDGEKTQP